MRGKEVGKSAGMEKMGNVVGGGGEVGEGGSLDLVDGGWSRETIVADWSD